MRSLELDESTYDGLHDETPHYKNMFVGGGSPFPCSAASREDAGGAGMESYSSVSAAFIWSLGIRMFDFK